MSSTNEASNDNVVESINRNILPEDVTLIINNQKISAHKHVLASFSEYFHIMFTKSFKERDQEIIEINITDVSYETLKTIIEFFYTSSLAITELNAQELLICSNLFLIEDVQNACVNYFKTMIDIENCFKMKYLAGYLHLYDLYDLCSTFIMKNFSIVGNNQDLLADSYDQMLLLVKNDNLFANEDMVYDVVMDWIRHDPSNRVKYTAELLWYVRMPLLFKNYQRGPIQFEIRNRFNEDFRQEHRKSFKKGILMLSYYPHKSTPEWLDIALNLWHECTLLLCACKNFQKCLIPPKYLCTCTLLDDGSLISVGGLTNSARRMCKSCGSDKIRSKSFYIYNLNNNKWTPLSSMNYARFRPYVLQQGPNIFVVGGCISLEPSDLCTIERYNLNTKRWYSIRCKIPLKVVSRINTYVTSVNGLIYIIGLREAGFYDYKNNSWHSIPQLPERKKNSAVCTLNSNIYIIGGNNGETYFKSVWMYCTEVKEWVSLADMNIPRSRCGAVVMNDLIYVFGGKSNRSSYLNTFEIYNPLQNEWKTSDIIFNQGRCDIDTIVIEQSSDFFKKVIDEKNNHSILFHTV